MQTISGFDENDSTSMDVEVPNYLEQIENTSDLKNTTVGIPSSFFSSSLAPGSLNPEIEKSFQQSIKTLEKLGAKVIDIELPSLKYAISAYYVLACAEASSNLSRFDGVRYGHRTSKASNLKEMYEKTRAEGFGDEVKRRIMMGTFALASGYYDAYYIKAQKVRTLIINDFKSAFEKCDFIATPTSPSTAFKIGEKMSSPVEMFLADIFTVPANLTGIPAISIPAGLSSKNLPIGFQLHANAFEEGSLLSAANLFLKEQPFEDLILSLIHI